MDKLVIKQIANQLKTERLNKGFTQQELSDATGISLRSIQRIERGEVYPRSFTLKALSEKLNLDFELLNLKNIPSTSASAAPLEKTNKSQKIVLSVIIGMVFFLSVCAFIFQSLTFPETAFEFVCLLALVIGIYGVVLFRIWR